MSEVRVITACENVCRDFFWLFGWLSNVATNPVWALFFGFWISLLIWRRQTKLSSQLDLSREKRTLYREFISQLGKAALENETVKRAHWALHPEVRRIWALQSEISLIGSNQVSTDTKTVLKALEYKFDYPGQKIRCTDAEVRNPDDAVRFEIERAIENMRVDINGS